MDDLDFGHLHSLVMATNPVQPSLDDWLEWREPSTGIVRRRTLLMLAAQDGSLPLIEAALLRGAAVNLQSPDDGVTALIAGAGTSALEPSTGNSVALDTIKLLLRYGADRDLKDHAGRSPLDIFLSSGLFTSSIQQRTTQPPPPPPRQELSNAPSQDGSLTDAAEAAPVQTVHRDQDNTAFSSADFRMFRFKIEDCPNEVVCQEDDWTECPFAHPGEKARRRDPRLYQYTCTPCPDFRKGSCKRGDGCTFAHGVFEGWLHPQKYRTQMCKEGSACSRIVCFFAHTATELREAPEPPPQPPASKTGEQSGSSPLAQTLCLEDSGWSCPPSLKTSTNGSKPGDLFCGGSSATSSATDFGRASADGHLVSAMHNQQSLELPAKPQTPDNPALPRVGPSPLHKYRPSPLEPPNSPHNHFDSGSLLSTRSSQSAVDTLQPPARLSLNGRATPGYSSRSSSPACLAPRRSAPNVPRPRKGLQPSMPFHGAPPPPADRLHAHPEQAQPYMSSSQQQQQHLHQLLQHQSWKLAQSTQQTQQLQQELLSTLNLSVNNVNPMWQQHQSFRTSSHGQIPSSAFHMQESSMLDLARSASSASSMTRMWPAQEAPLPPLPSRHSLSGPAWPASMPSMPLVGMDSLLQDQLMAAAFMEMSPEPAPALPSELVSWLSKAGSFTAGCSNAHVAPQPADPFSFHSQPFEIGNSRGLDNAMYL